MLLDRRLYSDKSFPVFPGSHVVLPLLRRAAARLAFGDGNLGDMTDRQVWPGPAAAAEGGGIFLAARASAFR